ncbi:MAG: hypothetical protein L6R39_000799 [Caloplaca ligustica]|nr:MAG: hypothetical protein L6R39_000799 [Caloplaca ligustica]
MEYFQFSRTTGDVPTSHEFGFRRKSTTGQFSYLDVTAKLTAVPEPVITGKRAAIARAAHEAGFDCSNPKNLLHLIDAVVLANNKFGYPDRWDGPAAFQSSIYPDTWTPAHAARRENKTYAMPYDDGARGISVPAFAVPATEILRTLNQHPKAWKKPKKPQGATGANREPLSARSAYINKRMAATQLPENQSFKRLKVENSEPGASTFGLTNFARAYTVNCMAVDADVPSRPPRSNSSRHVTARGPHLNRPTAQQRAAEAYQADAIAAYTGELLQDVVARLQASITNIDADREALRVRWEVDKRLQLLTITEHLKTLNELFARSEEGLRGSVEVIERFIM